MNFYDAFIELFFVKLCYIKVKLKSRLQIWSQNALYNTKPYVHINSKSFPLLIHVSFDIHLKLSVVSW